MKRFKLIYTFIGLIYLAGCIQNKPSNQQPVKEFDSIMQDTSFGFGGVQRVVNRFPSPGEMFGVINEGGLTYKAELLNPISNLDNYLNSKAQVLNLGIYIADFAYIALFGRQNESVDYLETIETLSEKVKVSEAINEDLVKRIKSNLGNVDSLVSFSDEAYLEMFSYCEDNRMHNVNALISAGAYIEGLHIALNNVDKYSDDNAILKQLAKQKHSFEHLLTYALEYKDDKNVLEVTEDLKQINEIFDSLIVEQNKSNISSKNNTLIIGGGKKYKFSKSLFNDLKKLTNKLRNNIIQLT